MPNIGIMEKLIFLTSNTKKAFNHLKQVFIGASIYQHFNLKSHIQIKTDVSGYAINRMLSLLNLTSNTLPNDSNSNKSDFGQ